MTEYVAQPEPSVRTWRFQDEDPEGLFLCEHGDDTIGPLSLIMLNEARQQGYLAPTDLVKSYAHPDTPARTLAEVAGHMPGALAVPSNVMTTAAVSPSEGVDTAQKLADSLKSGADAMDSWAKTAESLAEAGGKTTKAFSDLSTIDRALVGATMFARASTALGIAGAALGIASSVLSMLGPDPQAQMMKLLTRLLDSQEAFRKQMVARFEDLKSFVEVNTAKAQINDYINTLDSVQKLLADYAAASEAGDQDRLRDLEGRFPPRDKIFAAVNGIYRSCVEPPNSPTVNILRSTCNHTFGNLSLISQIGSSLLTYMGVGATADALVSQFEWRKTNNREPDANALDAISKNIASLYGSLSDSVTEELEHWSSACRANADANITNHLVSQVLPNTLLGDYNAAAHFIVQLLKVNHPWYDFASIVCEPRRGFDHIAFRAATGFSSLLSHVGPGGEKANILVFWLPRQDGRQQPPLQGVGEVAAMLNWAVLGAPNVWAQRFPQYLSTNPPGTTRIITKQPVVTQLPLFCREFFWSYHGQRGLSVAAFAGMSKLYAATTNPARFAILSTGKHAFSVFGDASRF